MNVLFFCERASFKSVLRYKYLQMLILHQIREKQTMFWVFGCSKLDYIWNYN